LLLVETEPPAGAALIRAPILVELRGVTRPGAVVTVNGQHVEVRPDGNFACGTQPLGKDHLITIEAQHNGSRKTTVRQYRVRV